MSKNRQGHTSATLMKQCLNAIEYLPLPPETQLSDFHLPSENQKNGELLFATRVQALQHMLSRSTLNKWQTEKNYIKHTIKLIAFGLVKRHLIMVSQKSTLASPYHLQRKYIILITMWQKIMSSISLICFTCPIMFLKETRTSLS